MDKYVSLLCKQNPNMTLECNNPECKMKFDVKTEEVFKNNQYKLICDECGSTTTFDSTKFADDFKKKLNEAGIKLG